MSLPQVSLVIYKGRPALAEAVADLVREAERKSQLHWTLLYLMEQGYQGPGVLVAKRRGQGVFLLPEIGLSTAVLLASPFPLDSEGILRFQGADLPSLETRFALEYPG
jgi:exoribonuclease-2